MGRAGRNKGERRHVVAEETIRRWAREQYKGRASGVSLTPSEVSGATGVYLTTVSTVLTYLSAQAGTGWVRVATGVYEYTWTEDESVGGQAKTARTHVPGGQLKVLRYLEGHPWEHVTSGQIATAVGVNEATVASALARFVRGGKVPLVRVVNGVYRYEYGPPPGEDERKVRQFGITLREPPPADFIAGHPDAAPLPAASAAARVHQAAIAAKDGSKSELAVMAGPVARLEYTAEPEDDGSFRLWPTGITDSDGTEIYRDDSNKAWRLVEL